MSITVKVNKVLQNWHTCAFLIVGLKKMRKSTGARFQVRHGTPSATYSLKTNSVNEPLQTGQDLSKVCPRTSNRGLDPVQKVSPWK